MKLIGVIIVLCVFTISSSIRVPSAWPQKQQNRIRTIQLEGSETAFEKRPYVRLNNNNKINSGQQKFARHPNPKTNNQVDFFKAASNDWTPIFPPHLQNPNQYYPVLYKNYRDDKTHEYHIQPVKETRIVVDKSSGNQDQESLEVPTRPVYPGEGKWAKKGRKYQPYITQHQFTSFDNEEQEDDDEKPEGHEIFEENRQFFNGAQEKFQDNLQEFPRKHNLGSFSKNNEDSKAETDDDEDTNEDEEFVPTKLYSQVRRSENEEHLPRDPEDARLKEVVKDSKIQTVYTEEGYEDSAYDHAGHEKNAEQDEGFSEFDKEIEKERQKKLPRKSNEDLEEAGTDYKENPKAKREKMKVTKDNFIKTEETKTTQVKDKDGNKELEISSEIKILATPNNGTKTHKFVKIFPKVYNNKNLSSASGEEAPDVLPQESAMKYVSKSFYKTEHKNRFKRFVNDISVDTDFIDKINTNLPEKPQEVTTEIKYPYYTDPDINPDSPLKYSEDFRNIPQKTEDDLAFYNQADRTECVEVEDDIDPIPDRVKNAEEAEESGEVQDVVKGPRLGNLGDKIDCFKKKYFGDNPLDSPIFQEEIIGPVKPIFKLFPNFQRDPDQKTAVSNKNFMRQHETQTKYVEDLSETTTQKVDVDLNILTDIIGKFNKSTTLEETKTELPPISIITTPKYTIAKTPKHIYDQIDLLQYLPTIFNQNSSETRSGKSLETTSESPVNSTEDTPVSEALLIMRKRRRRFRPRRRPYYHTFDVTKFLPTNPHSFLDPPTKVPKHNLVSEVQYKHDIKPSEQLNVFADVINNIKNSTRDSQLEESSNRVSIKLNSIGNQRFKIPHIKNSEIYGTGLDNIEENNSFYLSTTTMRPIIATAPRKAHRNNEDFLPNIEQQYENLELYKIGAKVPATTRKTTTSTTTTRPTTTHVVDDNEESPSEVEDSATVADSQAETEVIGLMPPTMVRYKTIYKPVLEVKMNNFYVPGMKPPSLKQKVYLYSDYKLPSTAVLKTKYPQHRLGKRSAQRPSYTGVDRNRNKPIDVDDTEDEEVKTVQDDVDDYVPHRPKNYHYDEETGRIVYDKKPEPEPEEEEEEYIVVTDAPIPKPTRKTQQTTPKFIEFTGPSYVEFIKKLKTDPKYQEIPDPTTTEKSESDELVSTTQKPVSTTPPEFLNILAKVRSDSTYKLIEDPDNKKKKKSTTTTEASELEDEEEEIEESQVENVQNSPGGQSDFSKFQIFDINEYLPKVKNYTPRTSIDYSKYKTIERPSLRHNLSSRYNSEEESLDEVKTVRVPILMQINDKTHVVSESRYEELEPQTEASSTTTTTTTTTTKNVRGRVRNRSRGTTRRPSTTTASSKIRTFTTTEPLASSVHHEKPRRVYPRRRPTRIKLGTTTTTTTESPEIDEDTTKIVKRRHYIPDPDPDPDQEEVVESRIITPDDEVDLNSTNSGVTSRPGVIEPRLIGDDIRSKILRRRHEMKKQETPEDSSSVEDVDDEETEVATTELPVVKTGKKDGDVQVFQKYDKTKKHGGNYRKENEQEESKKVHEVKRLSDVVPKPFAFYTDPKLPKNVNQLTELGRGEFEIPEEILEDAVEENFDYEGELKIGTTKKPQFVKDPGKRLYYYAPV